MACLARPILVNSDSENENVPIDSAKVCEFPVGIKNKITVTVEDYKTLQGEIIQLLNRFSNNFLHLHFKKIITGNNIVHR